MRKTLRLAVITAVALPLVLGLGQALVPLTVAAAAAQAPDPHPRLAIGARGNSVSVLQTVLKEVGLDPGPVDGIFGRLTERAVRDMQELASLPVDGVATPAVWEAIAAQRQVRSGVWQVQPGESLWVIAARTRIPLDNLVAWNRLANPRLIYAGQKIALKEAGASTSPAAGATATTTLPPADSPLPKSTTGTAAAHRGGTGNGSPAEGGPASNGLKNDDVAGIDGTESDLAIPAIAPAAPKRNPRVALTFDDGPTPLTATILKTLEGFGAQATFFMVGEKVTTYATIARQVTLAGHDVGSHGYTHRVLTGLSESDIITDIAKAQGIIFAVTGNRPQVFRPPGGASDASVRAALDRFGLAAVYWSNTFGDDGDDPAGVAASLMQSVHDGAILMLRETNLTEVAALPLFLEAARKAGVTFVPLDQIPAMER